MTPEISYQNMRTEISHYSPDDDDQPSAYVSCYVTVVVDCECGEKVRMSTGQPNKECGNCGVSWVVR